MREKLLAHKKNQTLELLKRITHLVSINEVSDISIHLSALDKFISELSSIPNMTERDLIKLKFKTLAMDKLEIAEIAECSLNPLLAKEKFPNLKEDIIPIMMEALSDLRVELITHLVQRNISNYQKALD